MYDAIVEAGKEFNLKHCGYYAQRAVRIEKFYAFWGQVRQYSIKSDLNTYYSDQSEIGFNISDQSELSINYCDQS